MASALSTASTGGAWAGAGVPCWLGNRLQNVDLDSGPIARYFEHLVDQNTPTAHKILVAADKVADLLGSDDSPLVDLPGAVPHQRLGQAMALRARGCCGRSRAVVVNDRGDLVS